MITEISLKSLFAWQMDKNKEILKLWADYIPTMCLDVSSSNIFVGTQEVHPQVILHWYEWMGFI